MKAIQIGLFCWAVLAASANGSEPRIDFDRDIAPILAAKCFECHGPDNRQRQAGLRLDERRAAIAVLKSGKTAIVPGNVEHSEFVKRIHATDRDLRMPPSDSNKTLSAHEINTLTAWIKQGAVWRVHWAFLPLRTAEVPKVDQQAWSTNPVDRFVLKRLELAGLEPAAAADKRTLIRRAYFDLIGLPPTTKQIQAFTNNDAPDAYDRIIDRLLSSPLYGQRWGRHWLDVARYGDSNGGDENHAYPNAFHYRNYVIDAFNRDLSFGGFVQQQIAGDLLPADDNDSPMNTNVATGFLAIGMKILAERDKVKQRFDVVDEQIDTVGKAILGLTLGCARCHDHKFDPIPTADYYRLAGIFHSTEVTETPIVTAEFELQQMQNNMAIAKLKTERDRLIKQMNLRTDFGSALTIEAEKFDRGNVIIDDSQYGAEIGIISDPGSQNNYAEFDIKIERPDDYLVQLRYAAKTARPGRILINGQVVKKNAISKATGGWFPNSQRWIAEGVFAFKQGTNVLRLESKPLMSHIDKLRLIPKDKSQAYFAVLRKIEQLDTQVAALAKLAPKSIKAMAVKDGRVHDVRVHNRGNHLSLGRIAPRGFLGILTPGKEKLPANQSGRLQLARWLTDSSSAASGLTRRVIVNRVWNWHFGRGIVTTPNNFGVKGARPSHPDLLDYLATRFEQDDWSIKKLHRLIMISRTYRMSSTKQDPRAMSVDPNNRLLWRFDKKRLEAEVIRDAWLFQAGRLDFALDGGELAVKTQDPSPADLQKNRKFYHDSTRRSVYLPVVRSNVYRFLTLFDFPNAATPVGQRDSTTVATQSLLLMNDPFVMQQSEHLARSILADVSLTSDTTRARHLCLRLFGRQATADDATSIEAFIHEFSKTQLRSVSVSDRRLEAWSALCHTLMISNDFLFVD